jgi:para-nitrobenzyl esterase
LNGDPNTKDNFLPAWEAWKPHKDHSKILLIDGTQTEAKITMSPDVIVDDNILKKLISDETIDFKSKILIVERVLNGRFFSRKLDEVWSKSQQNLSQ